MEFITDIENKHLVRTGKRYGIRLSIQEERQQINFITYLENSEKTFRVFVVSREYDYKKREETHIVLCTDDANTFEVLKEYLENKYKH